VLADLDGVVAGTSGDQSKYIHSLELRLKSSDVEIKSKDVEISALRTKLDEEVKFFLYGELMIASLS
jgi:hypothetical protein